MSYKNRDYFGGKLIEALIRNRLQLAYIYYLK